MDNGQRLSVVDMVEVSRKHLADLLLHKFSGPQLVNNFGIQLEPAFATYRDGCREAVLQDLAAGKTFELLTAQWEMHTRVRAKFVQALSKLSPHAHQPPSKPYRDTAKEFLLFIKGGQAAYGALLRAIHEKCPDVSMLGSIASSYLSGNSSGTSTPNPPQRSRVYTVLDDKTAALAISRDSLVYLGDLSRWRHKAHVDRQSQTPQWKKARLYYELAYEVDPDSGLAKHQLAVLAQDDGKYFPALASLYQSLASSFPHPQADNNLEMLMTRRLALPINQIIAKVKPSDDQTNVVATLRAWFLQLHVHFYKGVHFDQHGEMESEVLARLKQALKDGTNLDGTLLSMSLINMAAEFVAHKHAMENVRAQANAQMYFFCFRHNVRTFKILLEHFQEGLESQARTSVTDPDHSTVSLPVSGATLQTIRVYMLWFSVNWSWMQKCIETDSPEPEVAEYIRQLWRLLAHVLNAIYLQYPLFEIPAVSDDDLLVDEEEATMGFRPVQNDETLGVWVSRTRNVMKAVLRRERSAAEVKDHHMVRIRDIYTRALLVASNEESSLIIADSKVIFNESGIFSPAPNHLPEGRPATPPTVGGVVDPAMYPTGTDGQVSQTPVPHRKRIAVKSREDGAESSLEPTLAQDLWYDFPVQLPWLPEREQDQIWRADHPSMTAKTPWGYHAFALAWYPTG